MFNIAPETMTVTARINPATPPYAPDVEETINRLMQGRPPLALFATLARDERLFRKFTGGGLLDRGHLSIRQRELVIDRTTALCKSEYEWGVHLAIFGAQAGITSEQAASLVHGGADDACWSPEDALLIRMSDALHRTCALDDELWADLREQFSEEAVMELLMLAGFYRTVSYLTNALKLPLESFGARFPARTE